MSDPGDADSETGDERDVSVCSFCGAAKDALEMLWACETAGICPTCIEGAVGDLHAFRRQARPGDLEVGDLSARFERQIVGQVQAKRALIAAIRRQALALEDGQIRRPRILLVGPAGSGKSTLGRLATELVAWPSIVWDASALADAGEPGPTPEDAVGRLWLEAESSIEACAEGTLFLDGLDRSAIAPRCWEAVQRGVLRLLNDLALELPPRLTGWDAPAARPVATGALMVIAAARCSPLAVESFATERDLRDALVRDGLLSALVARFDRVVYLPPPDAAMAREILLRPGGLYEQAREEVQRFGATLEIPEHGARALADIIARDPDGGWAASRIVGRLVSEVLADPSPARTFVVDGYALALATSV